MESRSSQKFSSQNIKSKPLNSALISTILAISVFFVSKFLWSIRLRFYQIKTTPSEFMSINILHWTIFFFFFFYYPLRSQVKLVFTHFPLERFAQTRSDPNSYISPNNLFITTRPADFKAMIVDSPRVVKRNFRV